MKKLPVGPRCAVALCLLSWLAPSLPAQATPPYAVDFETTDGYSLGNLAGQDGWTVPQGSADIQNSEVHGGTFAVGLPADSTPAEISHAFSQFSGGTITYVDFWARPSVSWSLSDSTEVTAEGSAFSLVRLNALGHILVFDGDGSGGGRWVVTGHTVALDNEGQATAWVRFTIRQDYGAMKWDFYVNGQLALHDLGLRHEIPAYLSQFSLRSAGQAAGYLDSFYLASANPLATDADNDGLADSWETSHGLSASTNDRASDLDGDGLANVEEYALGTNPNAADSDADGIPDGWEVEHGTSPLADDASADPGSVGRTVLQSYQQSLSPWPTPVVADGLRAWFRADKGITKDGSNKVSGWVDVSGHGFSVGQTGETSRQPLFVGGAMNGQPAVQYDDPHKLLISPGLTDVIADGNDVTVIAVVKADTQQHYAGTILNWGGDGNYNLGLSSPNGSSNLFKLIWRDGGGNTQLSPSLTPAAGQVQVLTVLKDGVSSSSYLNGVLRGTVEVPATLDLLPAQLAVGNSAWPYYSFHGQIAEVLVYNRALTVTEREAVETALAAKYINPDADADGLPDVWEDERLGTRTYGPTDDPGSVGRTLLHSYQQELSPWPSPTVADGLQVWFRADKGILKDGDDKVSAWSDMSGHGFHMGQTVEPGRQPLFVGSAMNSQPAVQYDDPYKLLVSSGLTDVTAGGNNVTVIAVVKADSQAHYAGTILNWGSDGNYNLGLSSPNGSSNLFKLMWQDGNGGTRLSPALTPAAGQAQILTALKDGVTANSYLNGALQGSVEVPATLDLPPAPLAVGNSASPYYAFHGQIAEILVYNRALTAAERETVEAALAARYVNPDADADGLPDAWEDLHLGARTYGATDDPGSVGRTLLQSYQQELSPWPAPTVADGLRAWFRADKGITKDGDNKVSGWTDVSGHGFHVGQTIEPNRQPLFVAAAMNSLPAVEYVDPHKVLVSSGPTDVTEGGNDVTVIAVVKADSQPHYAGTILNWGSDGNYNLGLSSPNANANLFKLMWQDGAGNTQLSSALEPVAHQVQILIALKDGATSSSYLNGALQGSVEVPEVLDLSPAQLAVGNSVSPYYSFHGQIAEVLVYNRALSATEREAIETELGGRYLNLDTDEDGLSDAWETDYFGNLTQTATGDPDGDGIANLEEYLTGRNPTKGELPDTTGVVNLRIFQPRG